MTNTPGDAVPEGQGRGRGVHTVHSTEKNRWYNNVDGRIRSSHRLKVEAVAAGKEIAKRLRLEHSIHREDGAITEKNSYGNDPNPPKDKN